MRSSTSCWLGVAGALLLTACSSNAPSASETKQETAGLRLYVFDCGTISGAVGTESFGLKPEEVANPVFFTPCYLIVHPKGTLMWDTGEVADAAFANASGPVKQGVYEVSKPLLPQLAAVGYTPDQITYLALSHYHGDHTANAGAFAGSTWLVQEVERDAMFGGNTGKFGDEKQYEALKDARTELLHGDHDVFGDGTVVLKFTPGHTQGHQSLFLKLEHTGPILLSGDLYHYPEEKTLDRLPTIEADQAQTKASRVAMDAFMKETGAQLWIQHDGARAKTTKLAPEFYD